MATALPARIRAERRFYSAMALMMIALVLIGFAPSFYLRGIVHYPRPNPTLPTPVIVHGLVFSAWMVLFLVQTTLVATNRRVVHMRLGAAGMALGMLLVPLMYNTAVGQVARANAPPFTTPLAWTAVPLATIAAFVPLFWLAWLHRHNAQAHKRLMLSAALLMMGPALGRFPIAPPSLAGFAAQQVLALATFIPLFWWDRARLGRLHWATQLGAALAAAAFLLSLLGLVTPAWADFAAHLPGV